MEPVLQKGLGRVVKVVDPDCINNVFDPETQTLTLLPHGDVFKVTVIGRYAVLVCKAEGIFLAHVIDCVSFENYIVSGEESSNYVSFCDWNCRELITVCRIDGEVELEHYVRLAKSA